MPLLTDDIHIINHGHDAYTYCGYHRSQVIVITELQHLIHPEAATCDLCRESFSGLNRELSNVPL